MVSTHWCEPHELSATEFRALDDLARMAAYLIGEPRKGCARAKSVFGLARSNSKRRSVLPRSAVGSDTSTRARATGPMRSAGFWGCRTTRRQTFLLSSTMSTTRIEKRSWNTNALSVRLVHPSKRSTESSGRTANRGLEAPLTKRAQD